MLLKNLQVILVRCRLRLRAGRRSSRPLRWAALADVEIPIPSYHELLDASEVVKVTSPNEARGGRLKYFENHSGSVARGSRPRIPLADEVICKQSPPPVRLQQNSDDG